MKILDQGELAVTTAPQPIATAILRAKKILLRNIGAATIYMGNDGVTTGNGYPIEAGEPAAIDIEIDPANGLIVNNANFVVAAGSEPLRWLILG